MDLTLLGARIRELRLAKGLSLRELGAASGVDYSMIGHLEHARRNPTLDVVERIAVALGTSADLVFAAPAAASPRAAAIIDRFARIAPHIPDDELDVFIHELALWERRYGAKT